MVIAAPYFALASCGSPGPFGEAIRNAPAVFVGTVIDLNGGGRWATVEVQEVWKGGDLPAEAEVRGGPGAKNVATSVDRHYKLNRQYLFIPYKRNGPVFRDSACSRTTRFRTELNRFRPLGAGEPSTSPSSESPSPDVDKEDNDTLWALLGAAVVGSSFVALVLLVRR